MGGAPSSNPRNTYQHWVCLKRVVQYEYRYCMGTALCCTDLYWYSYYFADAVLVGYDTRTYHTVRYRYACVLRCE